ncbi:MAG TPA: alpha/beta family hydrolase [Vicinamibacterales bacterium]|jgi:S-formylglutathione hydrolase FrmB
MTRPRTAGLAVALLVSAAVNAGAQARTVRLPSATLGGERIFAILLPTNYAESEQRYPVLYLFHGGGQDHTAFMARTGFPAMARQHEMIVVMPAADRNYTSQSSEAQARYHDFVASELVDYVDSHYRTIASQQARAIGGISMGGRIAIMTALQHPARFGLVGGFSPAVRQDAEEAVQKAEGSVTYFYVSCGTRDSLLPANREFVAQLTQHHIAHDFKEIQGGEHAWNVWDPELGVFFDLLASREPWRTRKP